MTDKITIERETVQQIIDFLNRVTHWSEGRPDLHDMKVALRAALAAQPAPAAVPLTDEQVWNNDELMSRNAEIGVAMPVLMRLIRAVERAHGIAAAGDKP